MIVTQTQEETIDADSWSTWGSSYNYTFSLPPTYPVAFIDTPVVNISLETINGYAGFLGTTGQKGSATRASGFQVMRPTKPDIDLAYKINIIAIGRWK